MAVLFDDASSEYLYKQTAAVSAYPVTMACWIYVDDLTMDANVMGINSEDVDWNGLWLKAHDVGTSNCRVSAKEYEATNGARSATAAVDITVNTWTHACSIFASTTSRSAYKDGTKGTNTDTSVVPDTDNTTIGAIYYDQGGAPAFEGGMSGRIAESAIWNVALSDAEVTLLAKGFSPLFFQPQNLVGYWPLISYSDIADRVGDINMAGVNAPVTAVHPPIIYPTPPMSTYKIAAAAAGQPTMLRNITVPGTRQWQPQFPR